MNKKAFIKTLEAIIAIIFILGFVYMITPKEMKISEETPKNVKAAQEFVLQEILYNDTLRDCVINSVSGGCKEMGKYVGFCGDINLLAEKNTPYGYTYTCEICGIEELSCLDEDLPEDKSVYVDSVFISSDVVEESKIVRLYLWREEGVPVTPPEKTCEKQGYECCYACKSGPHSQYDISCTGIDKNACCESCCEIDGQTCSINSECCSGNCESSISATICCPSSSNCVIEGSCRVAVNKACTADDAKDNSISELGDAIDDIYCTYNEHDGCNYVLSSVENVGGQYNPNYWEGESCGGDGGSSSLYGEKKVYVDDIGEYSIRARLNVDDNSWVWINGNEVGALHRTCCGWTDWVDVTTYFQTGWNTIKFRAEDVCSGGRYFNLDWDVQLGCTVNEIGFCNDGRDNDCDTESDYDSQDGRHGDNDCAVAVTAIAVSESNPIENTNINVDCTSSVINVNSIKASIDGVGICLWKSWSGNIAKFDCNVNGVGIKTVRCSVDTSKSYQSGSDQTTTINVRPSDCSYYTTSSNCEADSRCDWCPECSGTKYSGGPNRCVDVGSCSYYCWKGKCGATCDDTQGTTNQDYYYQNPSGDSPTGTDSCYYRDYYCTVNCLEDYNNIWQYDCAYCKYISSSSCTETIRGSCSNYGSGTSCGTCRVCDGNGGCVIAPDGTGCGSNQVCRGGSCVTNVIVILNSGTNKNCITVCSENGGRTCIDVGRDLSGTDDSSYSTYDDYGSCRPASGYCSKIMYGGKGWTCGGIVVDWTRCRCSY